MISRCLLLLILFVSAINTLDLLTRVEKYSDHEVTINAMVKVPPLPTLEQCFDNVTLSLECTDYSHVRGDRWKKFEHGNMQVQKFDTCYTDFIIELTWTTYLDDNNTLMLVKQPHVATVHLEYPMSNGDMVRVSRKIIIPEHDMVKVLDVYDF